MQERITRKVQFEVSALPGRLPLFRLGQDAAGITCTASAVNPVASASWSHVALDLLIAISMPVAPLQTIAARMTQQDFSGDYWVFTADVAQTTVATVGYDSLANNPIIESGSSVFANGSFFYVFRDLPGYPNNHVNLGQSSVFTIFSPLPSMDASAFCAAISHGSEAHRRFRF